MTAMIDFAKSGIKLDGPLEIESLDQVFGAREVLRTLAAMYHLADYNTESTMRTTAYGVHVTLHITPGLRYSIQFHAKDHWPVTIYGGITDLLMFLKKKGWE